MIENTEPWKLVAYEYLRACFDRAPETVIRLLADKFWAASDLTVAEVQYRRGHEMLCLSG